MTSAPPLLQATGLTKRYPGAAQHAVAGIDLAIPAGAISVLVGPSGCGKTTILRLLAGFERPEAGAIQVDSRLLVGPAVWIPPEQRQIGIVFQDYALFPHLDVGANVAYGLRSGSLAERQARVEATLSQVGLADSARRRPHELSGGQQQRVALARALAPAPRLLLLDEPYSNLDLELRQALRGLLRTLVRDTGLTILLVTHDQEEALSLADWLFVMDHGRLVQSGTPDAVYTRPRTRFVAQFLGGANLCPGDGTGASAATPLGEIGLDRATHGRCWVAIRPEQIEVIAPDATCATGEVRQRLYYGATIELTVLIAEQSWRVMLPAGSPWQIGDRVSLRVTGRGTVLEDAVV